MSKLVLSVALCLTVSVSFSQTVNYSSKWFGPNANPVPEFTDARVPELTTISLMGDYYFGYGDRTENGYLKIEVPLIPEWVSFKVWTTIFEHYKVTPELSAERGMKDGTTSGRSNGDFYVQTRIKLFKESKVVPSVVLNSTLKTASGTNFEERRYFDTPGYYFDLEFGKSVSIANRFLSEIRFVGDVGFLCWETTNSTQNDAPMYGGKLIVGNPCWKLENTLSGYWGWMHTSSSHSPDYGDTPLVFATKFSIQNRLTSFFAQYQYGIKDFPYHQIRIGVAFQFEKLTPKFHLP
jgi:hypothetical protein